MRCPSSPRKKRAQECQKKDEFRKRSNPKARPAFRGETPRRHIRARRRSGDKCSQSHTKKGTRRTTSVGRGKNRDLPTRKSLIFSQEERKDDSIRQYSEYGSIRSSSERRKSPSRKRQGFDSSRSRHLSHGRESGSGNSLPAGYSSRKRRNTRRRSQSRYRPRGRSLLRRTQVSTPVSSSRRQRIPGPSHRKEYSDSSRSPSPARRSPKSKSGKARMSFDKSRLSYSTETSSSEAINGERIPLRGKLGRGWTRQKQRRYVTPSSLRDQTDNEKLKRFDPVKLPGRGKKNERARHPQRRRSRYRAWNQRQRHIHGRQPWRVNQQGRKNHEASISFDFTSCSSSVTPSIFSSSSSSPSSSSSRYYSGKRSSRLVPQRWQQQRYLLSTPRCPRRQLRKHFSTSESSDQSSPSSSFSRRSRNRSRLHDTHNQRCYHGKSQSRHRDHRVDKEKMTRQQSEGPRGSKWQEPEMNGIDRGYRAISRKIPGWTFTPLEEKRVGRGGRCAVERARLQRERER